MFKQKHLPSLLLLLSSLALFSCKNNAIEPPTTPSSLSQLSKADTLYVHSFQNGCDYSFEEKTKFFLNYDQQLCYEFSSQTTNIPNGGFLPIAGFVPDSLKNTYADFETGVKSIKDNPEITCTFSQNFTLSLGKDTVRGKENDCSFDKYHIFKEKLLGKINMDTLKAQMDAKVKACQ